MYYKKTTFLIVLFFVIVRLPLTAQSEAAAANVNEPRFPYGWALDGGAGFSVGFHHYPESILADFFFSLFISPRVGAYLGGLYRIGNFGLSAGAGIYIFGFSFENESDSGNSPEPTSFSYFAADFPLRIGINIFNNDWRYELLAGYYVHTVLSTISLVDGALEAGFRLYTDSIAIELSVLFSRFPYAFGNTDQQTFYIRLGLTLPIY